MSADTAHRAPDHRWPASEEEVYVAVTRAWCRAVPLEQRRKRPLGPYALGRGFARSVRARRVDGLLVASVCARLACRHVWRREGGELLSVDLSPSEALDPAVAWWRELEGSDGLGVHYVELGGGTLEFLSVALRNDRPCVGASSV